MFKRNRDLESGAKKMREVCAPRTGSDVDPRIRLIRGAEAWPSLLAHTRKFATSQISWQSYPAVRGYLTCDL